MLEDIDYEQMRENLPGYCGETSEKFVAELNRLRKLCNDARTFAQLLSCKWAGNSPVAILEKRFATVPGNASAPAILNAALKQQGVSSIEDMLEKVDSAIREAGDKQEKLREAGNDYGIYYAKLGESKSRKELKPLDILQSQLKQLDKEYDRYISQTRQLRSVLEKYK